MKVSYVEVGFANRTDNLIFRVKITEDEEDNRTDVLTYEQVIAAVAAAYEDLQPTIYFPHQPLQEDNAADVFLRPQEIAYIVVTPVRDEDVDELRRIANEDQQRRNEPQQASGGEGIPLIQN